VYRCTCVCVPADASPCPSTVDCVGVPVSSSVSHFAIELETSH
jgi:hypothetical protein